MPFAHNCNTATRGSNQTDLRAFNERLVLSLIRQQGPMAKTDLARATGLSAQTVSVIMRSLEQDGLLQKGDPQRGKVGQPSVPLDLRPDGAYFFGLTVGRRSLDLILIDFLGREIARRHQPHPSPDPDVTLRFANQTIAEMSAELPPAGLRRLAGMGIALPYRLWDWATGSAGSASWRDRDLAAELSDHWDFPIYQQNDATAACGAELVFGSSDRPTDFLYYFIGFFAGGGLVLDNALYPGRNGNAAALGSMPLSGAADDGKQLVDQASLAALEAALANREDKAQLQQAPENWRLPADTLAAWCDQAALGLAQATRAACCVIDLSCVIIDGWLPPSLRQQLVTRTAERLTNMPLPGIDLPEIRAGSIGSAARTIGAASLPLSNRFGVPRSAFVKG